MYALIHGTYHAFDEGDFFIGQAVFLVDHLVGPGVGEVLEGDKRVNISHSILSILFKHNAESKKSGMDITYYIFAFLFIIEWTKHKISLRTAGLWITNHWLS